MARIPDDAVFTAEWVRGVPTRTLQAKYGCTRSTVTLAATRLGLARRRTGRPPRDTSPRILRHGGWALTDRGIRVWVGDRGHN